MRKQLLVGVITGLAAFTLVGMGHETAQAATLPADYQGDWVAYVGKTKHHHVNYYYTARLTLADTSLATQLNVTKNANLSDLTTQVTLQSAVTYQLKTTKKHQVSYKVRTATDNASLGKFSLTKVKVKGQKTTALAFDDGEDDVVYAFRSLNKTHAWGDDVLY
ncbi:hypothetical protein DIS15_06450 [Levilactobacillus brevis]|uniref:hypothetical protein n=1 Tax=Levilactobacillus brevis TaxID=1580 RepID=UPI001124BD76|nr:hypothetical protein [Levilactobacillus brevis]TOY85014.1 hypothetical protein DIS15_06450 [Levilactobacillus brevis]